jgi:hypothetical protein
MKSPDEFYIGWEERAPSQTGRTVRRAVSIALLVTSLVAAGAARLQETIGVSTFEWGKTKTITGLLRAEPYPHLLVQRPGTAAGVAVCSAYYLVEPFKFGLRRDLVTRWNGRRLTLEGTLIYREEQTMVEVNPASFRDASGASADEMPLAPAAEKLGRHTLVGEIVDSKCYLGVMNPGRLLPHRGCAIRCISGGIPPILLVRSATGQAAHYLLTGADGRAVNREVLELVAEPVEISGDVERHGELLVLRSEPATYRRLTRRDPPSP